MLFDINNDNDIIYNARDCSVEYAGRKWYELLCAISLPRGYRMVGRVGTYHFYLPADDLLQLSSDYIGYFIRGRMNV